MAKKLKNGVFIYLVIQTYEAKLVKFGIER